MKNEKNHGILVVGHGSRREEANLDLREVAQKIKVKGKFPLVEAAFLEIAAPNIRDGFANLVKQGANSITVHPYFLSPGRHTRGDIPVDVQAAAAEFPDVQFRISEPLTGHDFVIEASIERINEVRKANIRNTGAKPGTVYIVGAGPGDADLLTLKAHKLLRTCDVVIYDYLVNPEILELAPQKAEKIYVGKIGGGKQTPQSEINNLMVAEARLGKRIVRLKGGDPFIFGRGGEEAGFLREADIEFEIVPGISSAMAVPAYAGIPLTHRGVAASFAVITGTRTKENGSLPNLSNYQAIDTLVILMGVSNLREISEKLIEAGRKTETPVAVIRWGTYDTQEVVSGNLQNIAEETEKANLGAPSIIVVGEVVALREKLNWFETSHSSFQFEPEFTMATEVAF